MEETVSMKMKLAELSINEHLKYVWFGFRLLFECQNLLISWIYCFKCTCKFLYKCTLASIISVFWSCIEKL